MDTKVQFLRLTLNKVDSWPFSEYSYYFAANLIKMTVFICYILPSSFVLTTLTGLAGPLPTDEKANTLNSYSVYLSKPSTSRVRVELLVMVTEFSVSEEFLILYSSLNPKSRPCRESAGGRCQDVRTLVEVRAVTLKLVGL